MANIVPQFDLSNITSNDDFRRFCAIVVGQILNGINGKLDFGNLNTQTVTGVIFPNANISINVNHNLGKTGVNWIVINSNTSGVIYKKPGSTDTNNYIQLASSGAATTVSLILF